MRFHVGCRGRIMLSSLPSLKRGLNKSAPDDALTCNIYREGGRRDEVKATLIDAQSRARSDLTYVTFSDVLTTVPYVTCAARISRVLLKTGSQNPQYPYPSLLLRFSGLRNVSYCQCPTDHLPSWTINHEQSSKYVMKVCLFSVKGRSRIGH